MINNPAPRDTSGFLRINELKNYLYCPRISFYSLCMDMDRITRLAELGIEAETDTKRRMRRRKHALHSVAEGVRHFSVTLWSESYRIIGQVDEIVETAGGVYLVDYKDTDKDYGYWQLQMAAYMACAVECISLPVVGCRIYTISDMTYHTVDVTAAVRKRLDRTLVAVRELVASEICPPPAKAKGKCRSCQYRRFCNDVF